MDAAKSKYWFTFVQAVLHRDQMCVDAFCRWLDVLLSVRAFSEARSLRVLAFATAPYALRKVVQCARKSSVAGFHPVLTSQLANGLLQYTVCEYSNTL